MEVKLVGLDLAKNVFQLCALNRAGRVLYNRSMRRGRLIDQLQQLEPTPWRWSPAPAPITGGAASRR